MNSINPFWQNNETSVAQQYLDTLSQLFVKHTDILETRADLSSQHVDTITKGLKSLERFGPIKSAISTNAGLAGQLGQPYFCGFTSAQYFPSTSKVPQVQARRPSAKVRLKYCPVSAQRPCDHHVVGG